MFIYISDIHLSDKQPISRIDSVFDAGMYKLEYVLKRAKELNTCVVCGGDFFHEPRVSYRVLNSVMDLLNKYKVDVYTVFGNHDLIGVNYNDDSAAIFTLIKSGLIKLLNKPTEIDGQLIEVAPYTKDIPQSYFFKTKTNLNKILVIHSALVPVKARFDHILLKDFKTDANLVLCGHIHQYWDKQVNNIRFISPACLIRRSISEKEIEPSMILVGDTITTEKISLNYKSEWCATTSEEVTRALTTAISDSKVEASHIEDYINSSSYETKVKEFCIDKIDKVRSENAN